MRYKLAIMIILSLGTFITTSADNLVSTMPIDPNTIFAEGVVWSTYEPPTTTVQATYSPHSYIDAENNILYFYDEISSEMSSIAIPDDIVDSAYIERTDDDRILLYPTYPPTLDDALIFDPITRIFSAPITVCDGRALQVDAEFGRWHVVYREGEGASLCQSATGEIHENILPRDSGSWDIYPSPDNTAHILMSTTNLQTYNIFAWDAQSADLRSLGTVAGNSQITARVCNWVSDTIAILCWSYDFSSWSSTRYLSADTQQEGILTPLFGGWHNNMFYREDLARYIMLESVTVLAEHVGSLPHEHFPCTIQIYGTEIGLHIQELGFECLTMPDDYWGTSPWYIAGDEIYYLATERHYAHPRDGEAVSTTTTLGRFNVATLEHTPFIYNGEFESILSISPDGRYIVLLKDDNQQFDMWFGLQQDRGYYVTVLDIESQWIVYQSPRLGVFHPIQVRWLDANSLIFASTDVRHWHIMGDDGGGESYTIPSTLARVDIQDISNYDVQMTTAYPVEFGSNFMPYGIFEPLETKEGFYIYRQQELIDLCNLDPVTLFKDTMAYDYQLHFTYTADDFLHVRVWLDENHEEQQQFTIDLSASFEQGC